MEKILISIPIRNNEKYLPYMFKIFDSLETSKNYKFEYLIYTNDNNEDKSLEILKNNLRKNIDLVTEEIPKNIKNLEKVDRLYHLRERILNLIKRKKFDYLLMLDSDIFFNLNILEKSISELKKENFEALTCQTLGSINFKSFSFFYDTYAHVDLKGKCLGEKNKIQKYFFAIRNLFTTTPEKVTSSFNGFWLTKYDTFMKKELSYLKFLDKKQCEHVEFNKKFNLGFYPDINPLRMNGNESKKLYKDFYNIINKNKYDNRIYSKLFVVSTLILLFFICTFIIYFSTIRKFIRQNKM